MAEASVYVARGERGGFCAFSLMRWLVNHAQTTSLEWVLGFAGKNNRPTHGIMKRYFWKKMGELPPVAKKPDRDVVEIWAMPVGELAMKEPANDNEDE